MDRNDYVSFLADYYNNKREERLGQAWLNRIVSRKIKDHVDSRLFYETDDEKSKNMIKSNYLKDFDSYYFNY